MRRPPLVPLVLVLVVVTGGCAAKGSAAPSTRVAAAGASTAAGGASTGAVPGSGGIAGASGAQGGQSASGGAAASGGGANGGRAGASGAVAGASGAVGGGGQPRASGNGTGTAGSGGGLGGAGTGAPGTVGGVTNDWSEIPEIVAEVQPSVVTIRREGGVGSGVLWNKDGIVITNNHVVEGTQDVEVVFADGTHLPGRVQATDPLSDL